MKNLKCLPSLLFILFLVACCHVYVVGQSEEKKLANINGSGSTVRWDVTVAQSGGTLTISAPDGRVFRKEFRAGASAEFAVTDKDGERLPDGQYTYELRLTPALSEAVKETLKTARGKDDDAEAVRSTRKRALLSPQALVQSGGFSVVNGAVIVAGAVEESGPRPVSKSFERRGLPGAAGAALSKLRQHHLSAMAVPDQVIPDDLIVQGSECVGLDCVNNETFNFDTIRLKENNTRIGFNDTSSQAGFPTRDWRIRANESASGGRSAFFIDDIGNTSTGNEAPIASTPFTLISGAPTNSIFVDSTGRLGLRTSTPVLDVHANTSNTPAIRFEQNNSGGFTAQTWDIAGNEANFFVRDVTGGSRLPFRIRPGAPTSSIDISADGDVGIGTASPDTRLTVLGTGTSLPTTYNFGDVATFIGPSDNFTTVAIVRGGVTNPQGLHLGINNVSHYSEIQASQDGVATNTLVLNRQGGNVGIGTPAPSDTLSVNGTASKPGGGSWAVFSDERLKTIRGRFRSGLGAVMKLQPIRYEYKRNNALNLKSEQEYVGFGAQALQAIIPEAVTRNENGYLQVNNDPILWTMLNAIKEQQNEIVELKKQIRQLRSASHRRR
jgi:endosialidase-like protein